MESAEMNTPKLLPELENCLYSSSGLNTNVVDTNEVSTTFQVKFND
jgi:hypothetical protein